MRQNILNVLDKVYLNNFLNSWLMALCVAVAMQNILSDLFASISIVLDKPFARC